MRLFNMPDAQKRIMENWLKLFSGSTLGSGLGFLATILMTRSIGVTEVGIVLVVQTFWRTLEGFLSFQSFQVIISHGANYLENGKKKAFQGLVKICLLTDIAMACVGALFGGVVFGVFHQEMNIPDEVYFLGLCGAVTMLTMVTGAYTGILRLFNRFEIIAFRDVIVGVMRVFLNGMALIACLDLKSFILIWIATEAVGNLFIIYNGLKCLKMNRISNVMKFRLNNNKEFDLRFVLKSLFTVNIATMIRVLAEEGDTLLVNFYSGSAGAALYKIAKNLTNITYKFTAPLMQSVYPEVAKIINKRDLNSLKKVIFFTGLQAGGVCVFILCCWVVLGDFFIKFTVGVSYIDALPIIIIVTFGYVINGFGFPFGSCLLAFNLINNYFWRSVISTGVFFTVAIPLLCIIGVEGAAYGQMAGYTVGVLYSAVVVSRRICKIKWDK